MTFLHYSVICIKVQDDSLLANRFFLIMFQKISVLALTLGSELFEFSLDNFFGLNYLS